MNSFRIFWVFLILIIVIHAEEKMCSYSVSPKNSSSPPTVFAAGFGGSSSRMLTGLLGAAGIYMTETSPTSQDATAFRIGHCKLDDTEKFIYTRLVSRNQKSKNNLSLTLFGSNNVAQRTFDDVEQTQLACLEGRFQKDLHKHLKASSDCEWGFKEPRLMYYIPLMHYGLGAKNYLHIVRDVRTMHHFHIEHDPLLWIKLLGGHHQFTKALDDAFDRVAQAKLPYPKIKGCHKLKENKPTCGELVASSRHLSTCKDEINKTDCITAEQKDMSRMIPYLVGWSIVHHTLASTCRTMVTASSSSSSSSIKPWLHIIRVETLWDRKTCHAAFGLLLNNMNIPTRTTKQNEWKELCEETEDERDNAFVYRTPNITDHVNGAPSLTLDIVTAMALPGLRAMGYLTDKEEEKYKNKESEVHLKTTSISSKTKAKSLKHSNLDPQEESQEEPLHPKVSMADHMCLGHPLRRGN